VPSSLPDLGVVQFEVLPFERVVQEASRLPAPTRLTVTSSPRLNPEETLEFAGRLIALGHTVIPHLAARMVRDRDHLRQLLERFQAIGLEELFVIGGDNTQPAGEFDSALQVLELVREGSPEVGTIGIAAYPEGHPLIDEQTLTRQLERKSALADYMVTQMTFDADVLLDWLNDTRSRGISLPVRVGLPGVVERRRLLEVSVRIGVGPSLRFVRKQRGLRTLLRRPELVADELFDALVSRARDPHLGIQGFHYFTLNQLCETWSWERDKHLTYKEAENR
jgi:methylenetetrahydrofolate reductase (NADPH)